MRLLDGLGRPQTNQNGPLEAQRGEETHGPHHVQKMRNRVQGHRSSALCPWWLSDGAEVHADEHPAASLPNGDVCHAEAAGRIASLVRAPLRLSSDGDRALA